MGNGLECLLTGKMIFFSIRTSSCLHCAILHLQNFSISCKSVALSRLFRLGSISCKQRVHVQLISLSFHWHSSPVYHVDVSQQSAKVKLPQNFEYLPLLNGRLGPSHVETVSSTNVQNFTKNVYETHVTSNDERLREVCRVKSQESTSDFI